MEKYRALSRLYKLTLAALIAVALSQVFFVGEAFVAGAMVYFTIESNVFILILLIMFVIFDGQSRSFCVLRGIGLLAITVTGIVYCCVLYPIWDFWGTYYFAFNRTVTHVIAPAGFLLDWLLFDRHGRMKWRDMAIWMAFPVIYYFVSFLACRKYGWYIYFFMDTSKGWGSFLSWTFVLLVGMLGISTICIAVDRWLGKDRSLLTSRHGIKNDVQ